MQTFKRYVDFQALGWLNRCNVNRNAVPTDENVSDGQGAPLSIPFVERSLPVLVGIGGPQPCILICSNQRIVHTGHAVGIYSKMNIIY